VAVTAGELDLRAIFRMDRSFLVQNRSPRCLYNKIIKTKSQDLEDRCTLSGRRIATVSALPQTHHARTSTWTGHAAAHRSVV